LPTLIRGRSLPSRSCRLVPSGVSRFSDAKAYLEKNLRLTAETGRGRRKIGDQEAGGHLTPRHWVSIFFRVVARVWSPPGQSRTVLSASRGGDRCPIRPSFARFVGERFASMRTLPREQRSSAPTALNRLPLVFLHYSPSGLAEGIKNDGRFISAWGPQPFWRSVLGFCC
jgi:hypothetical protein